MEKLKTVKKDTLIIALCVMVLTLTTIGVSYATIFDVSSNVANQDIEVGNLIINYSDSQTTLNNNYIKRSSDEVAINGSAQSTIYIQNNSSLNNNYNISVGYDYDNFINANNYEEGDKLIPLEYLKLAIFEFDTETKKLNQISDIISLDDTPLKYVDTSNSNNNMYSVFTDEIEKSSSGNNTKTLSIKIWIDEKIPEQYLNEEIMLKINVAEIKPDPVTDIIGTIDNLSNGTINLLNGSYISQIDETGKFEIKNIVPGVYTVNVYDDLNNNYETTILVTASNTVSYEAFNNEYVVKEDDNLAKIAYTYATTIENIKEYNNFQESFTLIENQTVKLPQSYKVNITENENLALSLTIQDESLRIK